MDSKQLLRKKLQQQRAALSADEQAKASTKIVKKIIVHPIFQESQTIAGYIAIHHEINPASLIKEAWQNHKHCYLPILQEKQLVFNAYQADTVFIKNNFSIPEPPYSPTTTIHPDNLDLVLVPLLAFTLTGKRLGAGGGFYDRSFSFLLKTPRPLKPFLLGLAYEWQKLETLVQNSWDVTLNAIATEKNLYLVQS